MPNSPKAKKSTLEKLRREIEADTKLANSEPERLARRRAEKLLGPVEVPKKEPKRAKGMER